MVLHFCILIETYGTIGMDVVSFVGRLIAACFIENEEVACNVCSRK